MLPPEVPENSDHRYSVTDGGADPDSDLSQQGVGWLLTRHRVKAITPPEIVGEEPASVEAGQHAGVRGFVTEQDTDLVALYTRRQETRRRVERLIILPEVANVVTRRREGIGDAKRNAALQRRATVRASCPEEAEESGFPGGILLLVATPELPERAHHKLHLRQVRATPGARLQVLVASRTLGRREGAIHMGGHELHKLPARHFRRGPHRPVYTPLRYGSSTARTLARARCSSTRVLVS